MSVSKLQYKIGNILYTHLGQFHIKENYRPEWLQTQQGNRLELDFYIKELRIAIEVQGRQHYEFVPFFHNDHDGFSDRLSKDRLKREICIQRGITLYEICSESDAIDLIESLDTSYEYPIHRNVLEGQRQLERRKKRIARQLDAISALQGIRDIIILIQSEKSIKPGTERRFGKHIQKAKFILDCPDFDRIYKDYAKQLLNIASHHCDVNRFSGFPRIIKKGDDEIFVRKRLPGRIKTRQRGNRLTINKAAERKYVVTGGESSHIVTYTDRIDFKTYLCDCRGSEFAKHKVCSHIWAVFSKINPVYTDEIYPKANERFTIEVETVR